MIRKLACVVSLAGCGSGPACGPQDAVVDRVIDGDTVVLAGGIKIRYLLVNAPEITNGHDDCYGANAAQQSSDLVLGRTVQLDYDVQCQDKYGRTLAYVTVDGQDVSRLLVERGFACVLHIPPNGDSRAAEFTALEATARAAKRGLWGACDPIPCN